MIVIIDYGMGNLGSIANMFRKIGVQATISSDACRIEEAERLVLPGVGAFDNGMKNLAERGLLPVLDEQVLGAKKPIFGLCLGMQLFSKSSEEGQLRGLGWLDAKTIRFRLDATNANLRIPHMGWDTIQPCHAHPLLTAMDAEWRFYFVHSYHVVCAEPDNVLAQAQHGYDFTAMVAKGNIVGAQFHPEKSHKFGMQLFKNFVGWS